MIPNWLGEVLGGMSTTVYAEEFNISLLSGLAAEKIGNDTKYFSCSYR